MAVVLALTLAVPPSIVRFVAAVFLLWILPAMGWALATRALDTLERSAVGAGLAFVVNGLLTLILVYLPGPFPQDLAPWLYGGVACVPWVYGWLQRGQDPRPAVFAPPAVSWRAVCVVLAIAMVVRFPTLGYSEFQGDEAIILRRAAQILAGEREQLFLHQKGPVEILMPLSLWSLTGTLNEWQARVPFTLMGVLAVFALLLVGRRWFNARAGVLAGLSAAIAGFLVAFSRIVQYQSVVVALSALSLLMMTDYARAGHCRALLLAAAFMAYGLLAHYDTVLFAPAAAWLLFSGMLQRRDNWRPEARNILLALLMGAVILALFYVPFMSNPNFAKTFGYLAQGRLGNDGPVYNNISKVWRMSTFYNSVYYVVGVLLLLVVGVLWHVKKMTLGSHVAPWLYLGVPLVFYLFLVFDPRTHIYTFYPGAAMMAAAVVDRLWTKLTPLPRWRAGLAVLGGLWYVLCAGYIVLAFISHTPEYKREWPASRHPLYPVTWDTLPLFGFFGFPYRAGWKAVEGLYAQGILAGVYASNEEPEVTTWYVRGGTRTLCGNPDLYILAENVQDEIAIDWGELEREYALFARIMVNERPKIRIYRRQSVVTPFTVRDTSFVGAFDHKTTFRAQLPQFPELDNGGWAAGERAPEFGDVARLVGYTLEPGASVCLSNALTVILYWEALNPTLTNYQVFTHLVAGGELVAQHDGAPACAHRPTSGWEPGMLIRDEHVIALDTVPDFEKMAPDGHLALYVGMYDVLTLDRLPVNGCPEDALHLSNVEVSPEQ